MNVRIDMIDGPLESAAPGVVEGAGAVVQFEGVVRPSEEGRLLIAIEYEAYRPMADEMLRALAEETRTAFTLRAVLAQHSLGEVPVGHRSFRLVIASEHRASALRATASFIDRMKRDVPIWKRPVYADVMEPRS